MLYLKRNLWNSIDFDIKKRRTFRNGAVIPILLKENTVTGATLASDAKKI